MTVYINLILNLVNYNALLINWLIDKWSYIKQ